MMRILYWNCNSLNRDRTRALEDYLTNSPPIHILFLLEFHPTTRLIEQLDKIHSRTYTLYSFPCPARAISHPSDPIPRTNPGSEGRTGLGGGIGVLIMKSIFSRPLPQHHFASTLTAETLEQSHSSDVAWFDIPFHSGQTLRVGGGYFHSTNTADGHSALLQNLRSALSSHNGPAIIGGDFNLHHHHWDRATHYLHSQQRTNANNFADFIADQNLVVLNTIFHTTAHHPTHHNTHGTSSVIDLVIRKAQG